MKATLPVKVQLTDSEQKFFDQIDFSGNAEYEKAIASGKASRELMESLLTREAIPSVRMSYFKAPYPGGHGKSHLDILKSNLKDRNLFEDSSFIHWYLRYFICGPYLPLNIIEQFCEIVNNAIDEREQLRQLARDATRNAKQERRYYYPDEFYKLALECIPDNPGIAESIREAAIQVRNK